ncbi:MAG TPA: ParA family protein [Bellilinea sp.]|jgi:chromosome partitioning protein|nr:ParA family protein [Bellilinea sp.]
MAKIIAVTNEKGGVAKTTSALSLAAALVERGKRVLLIDLDAQANLSLALGIEPDESKKSALNVFLDHPAINSVIQETGIPGLTIIPATHELNILERTLPTKPRFEFLLRQYLQKENPEADFILMDCPPFLGAVVLNALSCANLLLIPTQAEYFSIYALRNMMNLVRRVRAQSNPQLTYRLLVTMFDRRNRIHRTMYEQLQSSFGDGVYKTVITVDTRLRESHIAGLPIIYHAPKSRSAEQYRQLAEEVEADVKAKNQPAAG